MKVSGAGLKEPRLKGIGEGGDEHLEMGMDKACAGRKEVVVVNGCEYGRGVFTADEIQELPADSKAVGQQCRLKRKLTSLALITISIFVIFTLTTPNPASAWQFDVPLNQALVLEGGESTNPKVYDPAFYGGDKRIFSGLVSCDPQLKLTPDLAEKWDLSEDGMTYTFHLRQNAKFHNGRAVTAQDFVYR